MEYGEKENYIITYTDWSGKKHIVDGEASSESDAERQFKRSFNPSCQIIKIQTSDE
jgi:hypothetical protein